VTRFPTYSILSLIAGTTCLASAAYSVGRYTTTWLTHNSGPPLGISMALAFGSFIGTIALSNRAGNRFEQGKARGVRGCGCLLAILGICIVFALALFVNLGNCPEHPHSCRL
jgi:hypothetical protein